MKKKLLGGILLFSSVVINAATASLNFATEATYPPFEFVGPSGQMQGFDVDIVKALCQKMQTQCAITNQSFASLIPSLQFGKYDGVFGAMNITAQREKEVDFTNSYYFNTVSVVTSKVNAVELARTLKGKTVGVQSGTTLLQYLKNNYGNDITVNTYNSEEAAFLDLVSGRIDAVMGDTPVINAWLKKSSKDYVLVGQPIHDEKYFGKGYGIAVKKGNVELLNRLNKAITEIKADGTYEKIVKYYFGNGD